MNAPVATLPPSAPAWRVHGTRLWADYSAAVALVAVVLFAAFTSPQFATPQNLLNIVRQVSVIGIVALGMTLVIIVGGIDLSVGAVLALSGGAALWTLGLTDQPWLGVAAGLATGLLAGAVNGLLVTWGRLPSFIATLGMLAAARSLILYIADGGSVSNANEAYGDIANSQWLGLATPIWLFGLTAITLHLVMAHSVFGRYVYAVGSNERASRLSALPVAGVKFAVYTLCGGLAALGAVLESSRLNSISSANSGLAYELDAIAAVIIGGTRMSGGRGKVIGTVIGVLILGILNNALNLMNVSPYLQGMVKGLIIVLAVLVQKKD
jgi:ribose transport system permease protein